MRVSNDWRKLRLLVTVILIVVVIFGWLYCVFAWTGQGPKNNALNQRSAYEAESASIYHGLRMSIANLGHNGDKLKVSFALSFAEDPSQRWLWGFDHSWFSLHVRFWDTSERVINGNLTVICDHDPDFVRGRKETETVEFLIDVPASARSIGVQFESGPYFTKNVRIPEMARWYDIFVKQIGRHSDFEM
jgi:hypothetical protein